MKDQRAEGLVIRVTGHEIWVEVAGEVIPTVLRGRFRQRKGTLQVVAGDRVEVEPPDPTTGGQGTIEAVLERRSWLSRYDARRNSERAIVANIDILILVVAVAAPEILPGFVDRVLVAAERGRSPVQICINKIDLLTPELEKAVAKFESLYAGIGYPLMRTSAKTGEGVAEISALVESGIYAFAGQSGTGKSSLLNVIDPDLGLRVGEVAKKSRRGRHTTTYSQLYPIGRGYLADTPGMQTFGFPGSETEELADCFPEFRPHLDQCRFRPCTHSHEPDCAVKAALDAGTVDHGRYDSYLAMLEEVGARAKGRY